MAADENSTRQAAVVKMVEGHAGRKQKVKVKAHVKDRRGRRTKKKVGEVKNKKHVAPTKFERGVREVEQEQDEKEVG